MIERYNWAPVGGVVGKRHVPIVRVSFHTEKACYQLKGEITVDSDNTDPTSQVLSVTTQKTMDAPAGAISITLAGDKWFRSQLIMPNDLVVVQMGYKTINGEELSTVMVGLVDRIRRTRSVEGGMITSVTARDFGKVLIKSNVKFYPELEGKTEQKNLFLASDGWLKLMNYFRGDLVSKGTPAVILDIIMRFILPKLNNVEWTVWDEGKTEPVPKKIGLTHVLRYNFAKINMTLPQFFTLDQYEGSLWNLMERTSIKPFSELFVDTRHPDEAWNKGGKPRVINEPIEQSSDESKAKYPKGEGYYPSPRFSFGKDNSVVGVFMRNTPFDQAAWDKLLTHEIGAEDVIDEDLSYSDEEHYNLFWAGTTINALGIDLKRVSPPLVNEKAVLRYGLSPLEVEVEGLALSQDDPNAMTQLTEMVAGLSGKLKAWFENNNFYVNGSMTVRGNGAYKIGQRLKTKGIIKEFYIESVTQTFSVYEGWTTTLQLTRGRDLKPGADSVSAATSTSPQSGTAAGKTAAEAVKANNYTVKRGDSLWSIAAKVYGKGDDWMKLWAANKDLLIQRDNRNVSQPGKFIYEGQVLQVSGGSK
ncbi:LysM peptidoglycan-binding domain-containing protein [Paenibacillus durus]|uniref:LysM peptidoglycan-binding domain-containing protein n=1 Tax=Paenibacillus durus TaxID=44251 RepID=UPI00046ED3C1|nr:LysM peptidoglycan-binding domain-containing protein [Paenibacillus durus]